MAGTGVIAAIKPAGCVAWIALSGIAIAPVAALSHAATSPVDRLPAPDNAIARADDREPPRSDIDADQRRSFLFAYGIDPDRGQWIPVAGEPDAWRRIDAPPAVDVAGQDACPGFVFRNGFDAGTLSQAGGTGSPITYITSGGYTIKIDKFTLTITDAIGRNTVEHWGDPHENLNGKHIKDWAGAAGWDGSRRTMLLGDGSKVTMTSTGPHGVIGQTSIYDDRINVQFLNATNRVVHHGTDPLDAQTRDDAQHDGETALFDTHPITGVSTYTNIYNEDAAFNRVQFNVPLGSTGGCANPFQINDFFDDPRIGHT